MADEPPSPTTPHRYNLRHRESLATPSNSVSTRTQRRPRASTSRAQADTQTLNPAQYTQWLKAELVRECADKGLAVDGTKETLIARLRLSVNNAAPSPARRPPSRASTGVNTQTPLRRSRRHTSVPNDTASEQTEYDTPVTRSTRARRPSERPATGKKRTGPPPRTPATRTLPRRAAAVSRRSAPSDVAADVAAATPSTPPQTTVRKLLMDNSTPAQALPPSTFARSKAKEREGSATETVENGPSETGSAARTMIASRASTKRASATIENSEAVPNPNSVGGSNSKTPSVGPAGSSSTPMLAEDKSSPSRRKKVAVQIPADIELMGNRGSDLSQKANVREEQQGESKLSEALERVPSENSEPVSSGIENVIQPGVSSHVGKGHMPAGGSEVRDEPCGATETIKALASRAEEPPVQSSRFAAPPRYLNIAVTYASPSAKNSTNEDGVVDTIMKSDAEKQVKSPDPLDDTQEVDGCAPVMTGTCEKDQTDAAEDRKPQSLDRSTGQGNMIDVQSSALVDTETKVPRASKFEEQTEIPENSDEPETVEGDNLSIIAPALGMDDNSAKIVESVVDNEKMDIGRNSGNPEQRDEVVPHLIAKSSIPAPPGSMPTPEDTMDVEVDAIVHVPVVTTDAVAEPRNVAPAEVPANSEQRLERKGLFVDNGTDGDDLPHIPAFSSQDPTGLFDTPQSLEVADPSPADNRDSLAAEISKPAEDAIPGRVLMVGEGERDGGSDVCMKDDVTATRSLANDEELAIVEKCKPAEDGPPSRDLKDGRDAHDGSSDVCMEDEVTAGPSAAKDKESMAVEESKPAEVVVPDHDLNVGKDEQDSNRDACMEEVTEHVPPAGEAASVAEVERTTKVEAAFKSSESTLNEISSQGPLLQPPQMQKEGPFGDTLPRKETPEGGNRKDTMDVSQSPVHDSNVAEPSDAPQPENEESQFDNDLGRESSTNSIVPIDDNVRGSNEERNGDGLVCVDDDPDDDMANVRTEANEKKTGKAPIVARRIPAPGAGVEVIRTDPANESEGEENSLSSDESDVRDDAGKGLESENEIEKVLGDTQDNKGCIDGARQKTLDREEAGDALQSRRPAAEVEELKDLPDSGAFSPEDGAEPGAGEKEASDADDSRHNSDMSLSGEEDQSVIDEQAQFSPALSESGEEKQMSEREVRTHVENRRIEMEDGDEDAVIVNEQNGIRTAEDARDSEAEEEEDVDGSDDDEEDDDNDEDEDENMYESESYSEEPRQNGGPTMRLQENEVIDLDSDSVSDSQDEDGSGPGVPDVIEPNERSTASAEVDLASAVPNGNHSSMPTANHIAEASERDSDELAEAFVDTETPEAPISARGDEEGKGEGPMYDDNNASNEALEIGDDIERKTDIPDLERIRSDDRNIVGMKRRRDPEDDADEIMVKRNTDFQSASYPDNSVQRKRQRVEDVVTQLQHLMPTPDATIRDIIEEGKHLGRGEMEDIILPTAEEKKRSSFLERLAKLEGSTVQSSLFMQDPKEGRTSPKTVSGAFHVGSSFGPSRYRRPTALSSSIRKHTLNPRPVRLRRIQARSVWDSAKLADYSSQRASELSAEVQAWRQLANNEMSEGLWARPPVLNGEYGQTRRF